METHPLGSVYRMTSQLKTIELMEKVAAALLHAVQVYSL